MKRMFAFLIVTVCILFISCKDDHDAADRHCWIIIDANGNDIGQVCNKTELELQLCAQSGSCGNFSAGTNLTPCQYYQADGPKFCYMRNNTYLGELTESQAALYERCFNNGGATFVKVTCGSCAHWFHRIKRTGKANGNFNYSVITREQFCGDTLSTIFQGRQVVLKDDADSLVVRQFSNNGVNW